MHVAIIAFGILAAWVVLAVIVAIPLGKVLGKLGKDPGQ